MGTRALLYLFIIRMSTVLDTTDKHIYKTFLNDSGRMVLT